MVSALDKRFDTKAVVAIMLGSIILAMANRYLWEYKVLPDWIVLQFCSLVVIIIAAIYGDIAGFIVPAAACAIVGAILSKYVAIEEFLMLGVIGIGTGYYANRFRVREGEFGKSEIRLFLVIEAIIAVFMWLFARPMTYLYLYKLSMIEVINSGFKDLIAELLLVCVVGVPILIFMSFIAKQYMLADVTADNEKGDF